MMDVGRTLVIRSLEILTLRHDKLAVRVRVDASTRFRYLGEQGVLPIKIGSVTWLMVSDLVREDEKQWLIRLVF